MHFITHEMEGMSNSVVFLKMGSESLNNCSIFNGSYLGSFLLSHSRNSLYILFLMLSSIMLYPKRSDIVPCIYNRTPLLIHSEWNSSHLLIPNSQPNPFPCPLGNHMSWTGLFLSKRLCFGQVLRLTQYIEYCFETFHLASIFIYL